MKVEQVAKRKEHFMHFCLIVIALSRTVDNKVKLFDLTELLPILTAASTKFAGEKEAVKGLNLVAILAETIARATRAYDQTSVFEVEEEKKRLEAERKAGEVMQAKI